MMGEDSSAVVQQLVDVGGYRLALQRRGVGSPTVVLDAGLGDGMATWSAVVDAVAHATQVVAYDRAGVGASEPASTPRTGQDVVRDLHALLMAAQIPRPYVLVGQSWGGYTPRLYAHQYPDDVAGMVLVDAPHEDRDIRLLALLPPQTPEEAATLTSLRHLLIQGKQGPAQMPEGMDLLATEAQVRATGSFGARPLVVLTAGREHPVLADLPADVATRVSQLVQDGQRDLASLSSRSHHIIAHESGHHIQLDQPHVVIDAIRQVVAAVRGDQPLVL